MTDWLRSSASFGTPTTWRFCPAASNPPPTPNLPLGLEFLNQRSAKHGCAPQCLDVGRSTHPISPVDPPASLPCLVLALALESDC